MRRSRKPTHRPDTLPPGVDHLTIAPLPPGQPVVCKIELIVKGELSQVQEAMADFLWPICIHGVSVVSSQLYLLEDFAAPRVPRE